MARRYCISVSLFLPSLFLSWKADMFRKIKIRKMTLNRALD
ncbi:integrase, partial [Escherichia coli]|nr:integrase [Escherichia coli]MDN0480403.1 integrase [Escherichia coli]